MVGTLFDITPDPCPFVLWHRASGRHKWRVIGSAPTGHQALALMDTSGHKNGEWYLAEGGIDPNEKRRREAKEVRNDR